MMAEEEVETVEIQWAFDPKVSDLQKRRTSKAKVSEYISRIYGIEVNEDNWPTVSSIVRRHRRMKRDLKRIKPEHRLQNFKEGKDKEWQ